MASARRGHRLGGARPGGKRGRGAAGKIPFVAAVETIDRSAVDPSAKQRPSGDGRGAERKPRRLRLTVVKGFRKQEVEKLAKRDFAAGSNVVTDGLSCWTAVEQAGCRHFPAYRPACAGRFPSGADRRRCRRWSPAAAHRRPAGFRSPLRRR
jgi:hypothetical protein